MLFKTYQKITTLFKEHHGYMSFADLRDHQVTVLQLAEMEEEGSLERFARGWYWCKDCGYEKPEDYQYIEIAKVNPRAVICMDSAAWLAGMLKEEPATIAVATARTDRKKMDLENFEIRRFYFQNADVPGEICEKKTVHGDLALSHALEKAALRLRRCTVDLIGKQNVAEGRAFREDELSAFGIKIIETGDIGRQ